MDDNLCKETEGNKVGELENDRPPSPVINMNKSSRKSFYGKLHQHRRTRGKPTNNSNNPVCVSKDTSEDIFVFGKETVIFNEIKNNVGHRVQKIVDIENKRTEYFNIMRKENQTIEKCDALEDFEFKKPTLQRVHTKNTLSPPAQYKYETKNIEPCTLPELKIDLSPTTGFKTGSGRSITVSKSTIKKHSKLFEDIFNSTQNIVQRTTKTSTMLYKNNTEDVTHKKMHKLFENKQFSDISTTSQSSLNCSSYNPEVSTESESLCSEINNSSNKMIDTNNEIKSSPNLSTLKSAKTNTTNTTVEREYNELQKILIESSNSDILKEKTIKSLNNSHKSNDYDNNTSVTRTLNEVNERCENILGVLASATSDLQEAAITSDKICKGITPDELSLSKNKTERLINTVDALKKSVNALEREHYGFNNSEIKSAQNHVNKFEKNLEEYEQKLYALFENHIIKKIQKCKSIFSVKSVNELERQKFLLEKTKEIVEQCRIKLQSEIEALEDHTIKEITESRESVKCKKKSKTMSSNNKRSNDDATNSPRKRLRSYTASSTSLPSSPRKRPPLKEETLDKSSPTTEWCSDNFVAPIKRKNCPDDVFKQKLNEHVDSKSNIEHDNISVKTSRQMEIALEGPNSVHIGINMKKQNSGSSIQIDLDFNEGENKLSIKSPSKQQSSTVENNKLICETNGSSVFDEQESKSKVMHMKNEHELFALDLNCTNEDGMKIDFINESCCKNIDFKMTSKNNINVSKQLLKNELTVYNNNKSFSDNYALSEDSKSDFKDLEVKLSECDLNKNVGFKTANMKNIEMPEEAIKKALSVFKTNEDFAHDVQKDLKIINDLSNFGKNAGFTTAGGRNIDVSKQALKKVLSTFKDIECFTDLTEKTVGMKSTINESNNNVAFGTASGKDIKVSKTAVEKALCIFGENEKFSEHLIEKYDDVQKSSNSVGFSTATGKNIAISKQALQKASCLFKESNNLLNDGDRQVFEKNTSNVGFSTAAGKNIMVSRESLKKAFAALGENDCISEDFDADTEKQCRNTTTEESEQTQKSTQLNYEFCSKNIKREYDPIKSNENKSSQGSSDDSLRQEKRNNRSCKKRLGMSVCKPVELPASKLEKAKSLFEGFFDDAINTSPVINRSKPFSTNNVSYTSTPQRVSSHNVYSSTPVRETKNLPIAPTLMSHEFYNVVLDNPNITPIKNEKPTCVNENARDIIITNTTEGGLTDWQINLDREYEDIKRRLNILTERKKMLEVQAKILQNPMVEHTRRRLGVLSTKKQQPCRISLRKFVDNAIPRIESNQYITPQNAVLVHFDCFKCDETKELAFLKTSDDAIVVPNMQNYVGLAEIATALKTMPGVEIRLIPNGWIDNHYKWIVWKLARLENMFPDKFRGCLSVENVMMQLKYRYDREIDRVERSALRLIFEGDDAPQRRMILCVSNVYKDENCFELELTDGWYSIRTIIDRPLCQQVLKSHIKIGTKIITHGAQLVNCEPCYPLEAPSHARLKINYNSTRLANWDAKLGFQKISGPLPIRMKTIDCDGGRIGCLKLYIARKYPLQYLEKQEENKIIRNEKAEQLRAQEWDSITSQKRNELQKKLYQNEYKEFHRTLRSRTKNNSSYKQSDVLKIDCPQTLYEIIQNSNDPDNIREMLTSSQLSSVVQYESNLLAKRNFDFSSKLDAQINEMQLHKRNVSSVLQLRVLDGTEYSEKGVILKVWNPSDELEKLLKEESTFSVYNLTPNVKGDLQANTKSVFMPENSSLTQYKVMGRKVLKIELTLQKFCKTYFNEFDTVGVVIKTFVGSHEQYLWLSDASERLLLIRIFEGPHKIALLENLKKGHCVAAINLTLREPHKFYGQAIANYVTIISSYPKHHILQEELKSFTEQIDVLSNLLNNCEKKVSDYESDWNNVCSKSSVSNISDLVDSSDESTMMQSKLDATDIAMSLLDTDQLMT